MSMLIIIISLRYSCERSTTHFLIYNANQSFTDIEIYRFSVRLFHFVLPVKVTKFIRKIELNTIVSDLLKRSLCLIITLN